ncbi:phenylacetate--CoA ligase family protein [Blastococcus tunisiensis]|uniref:Phenylacetate-CoA ligase n=1 Tax=Blastococcus tunisiensis TaxID=1798228 RepID=A0A1I2A8T6_9ACTN|nr:phenylacetate--CoA ligase family protein [Blastococcus sp. DSM 46838]SFE40494.1 phenylacetate-CoA ligase [Blastococcus sp. DSM 46838]
MTAALPEWLPGQLRHAYDNAPAVRRLMDEASIAPDDVRSVDDLVRIPVTTKDRLLELQHADPPFGGFLAVEPHDLRHVFVSPGPLFDPQGHDEIGLGFQRAFRAAGIGPGDTVLNTWSYHLVPAGLVMDEALVEVGATVVPGGVGNSEVQAELIRTLGVTVVLASTPFFITLAEALTSRGHHLPDEWNVRLAFLGGEFGDWMAKRRRLEQQYGLTTSSAYATGDVGLIGYECPAQEGYHVGDNLLVQICDPTSGAPLPDGERGEVVVTTSNRTYPLTRFGTGDVSYVLPPCSCGDPALRLAPLQGRVGQAVKAKEIFIYPRQAEETGLRLAGVDRAQVVVTRNGSRDHVLLRLETPGGEAAPDLAQQASETFLALARMRPDDVRFEAPGAISADEPLVIDRRQP